MKPRYRPFKEARNFVQTLGIETQREWFAYCNSGKKPEDIPSNAYLIYKNNGWVSWPDWYGSKNIAPKNRKFRDIEDAKKFVHPLKLKNREEWKTYLKNHKIPNDIPRDPTKSYKNKGWISWGDFLGTGRVANQEIIFLNFNDARKFAHGLGLKNQKEWREFAKTKDKPVDIPVNPDKTYENKGWKTWGDFLGTGRVANQTKSLDTLPWSVAKKLYQKISKEILDSRFSKLQQMQSKLNDGLCN